MGTTCIEYLIRSAVELGGPEGVSVIIQNMLETGFMKKIMEGLYESWTANQTTGPNKKYSSLNTVTEQDAVHIRTKNKCSLRMEVRSCADQLSGP